MTSTVYSRIDEIISIHFGDKEFTFHDILEKYKDLYGDQQADIMRYRISQRLSALAKPKVKYPNLKASYRLSKVGRKKVSVRNHSNVYKVVI